MPLQNSRVRRAIAGVLELTLLLMAAGAVLVNQYHLMGIHKMLTTPVAVASGVVDMSSMHAGGGSSAGIALLPHGVPQGYGSELRINFDNAAAAMPILQSFDEGPDALTFSGDLLQRYIAIGSRTACEFCCGATTLVFPDGRPACACAHSAAMRGLARYLLVRHPEMSDAAILTEVNQWKAAFFPGPTIQKAGSSTSGQPTSSSGSLPSQVGGC